jgi:hypothetical protein
MSSYPESTAPVSELAAAVATWIGNANRWRSVFAANPDVGSVARVDEALAGLNNTREVLADPSSDQYDWTAAYDAAWNLYSALVDYVRAVDLQLAGKKAMAASDAVIDIQDQRIANLQDQLKERNGFFDQFFGGLSDIVGKTAAIGLLLLLGLVLLRSNVLSRFAKGATS